MNNDVKSDIPRKMTVAIGWGFFCLMLAIAASLLFGEGTIGVL